MPEKDCYYYYYYFILYHCGYTGWNKHLTR